MKNKIFVALIALLPLVAFTHYSVERSTDKDAVEQLVLDSYINGAFNGLDPDAMLSGFHEDFAIFSADGEKLSRYEIETWADGVKKRKNDPKFDPANNVWEYEFATVDLTGNVATVKVELSRKGKHVYTDYLSLIKFDSGWKIVAKVYYKHD